MSGVLLTFLFILQFVSFFLIAILFTRLSNIKDIEKKHEGFMKEMDDAVSAYLFEIKDENNRLIEELASTNEASSKKIKEHRYPIEDVLFSPKTTVSKSAVAKLYQQTSPVKETVNVNKEIPLQDQVATLSKAGKSVEEIAKLLEKGKTEIELMIKFHHE
ncbi:MAG: hypothetical protein ABWX61_11415 [Paenisporosarcina sp.]